MNNNIYLTSTWTFDSVVFPSLPTYAFRFILTNGECHSKIWFEDKSSKMQWSFEFSDVRDLGNGGVIDRIALIDYLKSSLASINTSDVIKGSAGNQTVELEFLTDSLASLKLQLSVGGGGMCMLVYRFEMMSVKLTKMDILESRLKDALEQIKALQAEVKGNHETFQEARKCLDKEARKFRGEAIFVQYDLTSGEIPKNAYINWSKEGDQFYTCENIQLHKDEIRFGCEGGDNERGFPSYRIESLTSAQLSIETFSIVRTGDPDFLDGGSVDTYPKELREISGRKKYMFRESLTKSFILTDEVSNKDTGTQFVLKIRSTEELKTDSNNCGSKVLLSITRVA